MALPVSGFKSTETFRQQYNLSTFIQVLAAAILPRLIPLFKLVYNTHVKTLDIIWTK